MKLSTIESGQFGRILQVGEPSDGIRVYSGDALDVLPRLEVEELTELTHKGAAEYPQFMRPVSADDVADSIRGNRFSVARMQRPDGRGLYLATAQVWQDEGPQYEVGTVLNLAKDHPDLALENPAAVGKTGIIVFDASSHAQRVFGAEQAVAMAATANTEATRFFDGLEGVRYMRQQPSTFVKDARGAGVPMKRYDVTKATGRKKPERITV